MIRQWYGESSVNELHFTDLNPAMLAFWAKSCHKGRPYHPLWCHALDTAATIQALWARALPVVIREHVLQLAEAESEITWVACLQLLAALHDLGKATPGFQAQWPMGCQRLKKIGFVFPLAARSEHDRLSLALLPKALVLSLQQSNQLPAFTLRALAWSIAGHHQPQLTSAGPSLSFERDLGIGMWRPARNSLVLAITHTLQPTLLPPGLCMAKHELLALVSGLVELADWIASTNTMFPPVGHYNNWPAYWQQTQSQARHAVDTLEMPLDPASVSDTRSVLQHVAALGSFFLARERDGISGTTLRLERAWERSTWQRKHALSSSRAWLIRNSHQGRQ